MESLLRQSTSVTNASMQRASTLIDKILTGMSDAQDEQGLRCLVRSTVLTPGAAAMCLTEAVCLQNWLYVDDSLSTPSNNRVLLSYLAMSLRPAIKLLSAIFEPLNNVARRNLVRDAVTAYMSKKYMPLVTSIAEFVSSRSDVHIELPRAHADLRVLFTEDSVGIFEMEVLRNAEDIADQLFSAEWARAAMCIVRLVRIGPFPEMPLWPHIRQKVITCFVSKHAKFFVSHCQDLFDEGSDVMEYLCAVIDTSLFVRALITYLKLLKAQSRVTHMLRAYARFSIVLSAANRTDVLRTVLTPSAINRLLEHNLHMSDEVLTSVLDVIVGALSAMPSTDAAACVRLMRARAIKRILSLEAVLPVELRVSLRLAEVDKGCHQSLLNLLCAIAFPVRRQLVDSIVVCAHTAPEKLPEGFLPPRFFDVVPDIAIAVAQLHDCNSEKVFKVCLAFGYSEFAVTLANGARVTVSGNTAHYILAARIGRMPAPRREELLELMDDRAPILDAALNSMSVARLIVVDSTTSEVRFNEAVAAPCARLELALSMSPARKN